MSRFRHPALVALVGVVFVGPAQASDQTDWPVGIASISIVSATPTVHVTVQNLSNSTSPDERELFSVSAAPAYALSGQVFCKGIMGGTTRLVKSQLLFGTPVVTTTDHGTMIWPVGVWDASDPIAHQGNISSADVHFDHAIDLPGSWNGGLHLGFNPVKMVEDRLATHVANGGSAADFLRQDDVFEVKIPVNLVGECQNTSTHGVHNYEGYTRRWITAAIFYRGDPEIEAPSGPVVSMPDALGEVPPRPPQHFVPTSRAPNPVDDDERDVTFGRFSVVDLETGSDQGLWSGWVTYGEDACPEHPWTAVATTGECVVVPACMPAEFESCRALDGCCDALARASTDATR